MVFITIMTRGTARFFRFFLKNLTGARVVKESLTTPDKKTPVRQSWRIRTGHMPSGKKGKAGPLYGNQ